MASLDVFEPEVIHDFVDKFVAGAGPGVLSRRRPLHLLSGRGAL